jgi:LPS export ABC transporter protein LptC
MNKKLVFQLLLILFLIAFIAIFILYFSKKNEKTNISDIKIEKSNPDIANQNLLKNIQYNYNDNKGNNYEINAESGKIRLKNSDLIYMTNVTAYINLNNHETITINSDYANFNNKSYETKFIENVLIIQENQQITSEELYFSLEDNIILISKEVTFNKPGFNLKADKVEIDLITKNSKIFMDDKNKKIIVLKNIE